MALLLLQALPEGLPAGAEPAQTAFQTVNAEEEEGHACFVLSSNYLVVLTSVFLEDANFTNSLHLTFQPPVICSLDKTVEELLSVTSLGHQFKSSPERLTNALFLKQELSVFGQSGAHLTPLFLRKTISRMGKDKVTCVEVAFFTLCSECTPDL
ncbi:hypothetical protein TURU_131393 [Turdus rufiventris]|nr:hypothetical protein TURU_131393 [Turdus rufiventris]